MGRAGLNRKTALATLTLTLAAEAPDLDVVGGFWGRAIGFAHHRGFTHSFLGVPLVAALVTGFVYLIWRIRGRKTNDPNLPPRWGPFSERWYSWDIVFIVEPVMLGLLILGLVIPSIFALVDKDIGVRNRGPRGRLAASLALIGIVLMWGVRDYEHRRAVTALQARNYNSVDPIRVSAYPKPVDPFHWYGVVETPAFFALAPVDSLTPDVDDESMYVRYKPEETPITLAAKKSYAGRVFLDWAQYPITETEVLGSPDGGYIVHFQDLRYLQIPDAARGNRGRRVLGAAVEIDKNLHVVGDVDDNGSKQIVVPDPGQR